MESSPGDGRVKEPRRTDSPRTTRIPSTRAPGARCARGERHGRDLDVRIALLEVAQLPFLHEEQQPSAVRIARQRRTRGPDRAVRLAALPRAPPARQGPGLRLEPRLGVVLALQATLQNVELQRTDRG